MFLSLLSEKKTYLKFYFFNYFFMNLRKIKNDYVVKIVFNKKLLIVLKQGRNIKKETWNNKKKHEDRILKIKI